MGSALHAQEASSGFDLRATVTGQTAVSNESTEQPRSGSLATAGFRSVVYPLWKISDNLTVTSALQFVTRPYFYSDLSEPGYGANGNILQASLNYSRVSANSSILFRAGELSTAFGSFMLRYDDMVNPLVDLPPQYAYYGAPVSTLPVAGAQLDATRGKWDGRVQFANSSPANPRSLFARDQYGNWAGGAGYTIRQGFRVGASAYYGPFLNRRSPYFWRGELAPSKLSANAAGIDAAWTHGHTTLQGELQRFVMPYTKIPTLREWAEYGEIKQALGARWFIANRTGYTSSKATGGTWTIESAAAFRPNRFQLIKASYEFEHYSQEPGQGSQPAGNTLAIQVVSTIHFFAGRD